MSSQTEALLLDLNTGVKCCEGQMSANLGGELAILNLKTGVYFGLNEVGGRIWNLLSENKTLPEVRDLILAEYTVEKSECEHDLVSLVTELARHQLVEITTCD